MSATSSAGRALRRFAPKHWSAGIPLLRIELNAMPSMISAPATLLRQRIIDHRLIIPATSCRARPKNRQCAIIHAQRNSRFPRRLRLQP
jgi:hypothetical protein